MAAQRRRTAVAVLLVCIAAAVGGAHGEPWVPPKGSRAYRSFAAAKEADLTPQTKQSPSYIVIRPDTWFLAPNCKALYEVFNYIRGLSQGVGGRPRRFIIELPCKPGFASGLPGGTWDKVDYNCYDPLLSPQTNGSLNMLFTSKVRATLTVRAYSKGGCDLRYRNTLPELYGSAPFVLENGGGYPFFTFGSDDPNYVNLATVFVQNIRVWGNNSRPGIDAYSAKALNMKGVDIYNTTDLYEAAGLSVVDTKTRWTCSFVSPCVMRGSYTYGVESLRPFWGAGGAVAIQAINVFGAMFYSYQVSYRRNTHTSTGGVFYVRKLVQKGVSVRFAATTFANNQALGDGAGGCAVGATYRQDGGFERSPFTGALLPKYGSPLTVSASFASWKNNDGPLGPMAGILLCSTRAINTTWTTDGQEAIMPFLFGTKVFAFPLKSTTSPPSPIDGAVLEQAFYA